MWDQVMGAMIDGYPGYNHMPGGGNVLYMDGHVEFPRYSTRFPISSAWVTLMLKLDSVMP